ncbi:MAG TPA: hypothetical protein IGS17_19035 [Oscillatoriales cyanobacterium M59_W2019_021]|nr:MAG: hypothetical protein D6728_11730 [Cyanobacteria bacterium J055]HIK32684.1 hypothetical protein [Oscillatoriales cyanobacterium M4454_W2019_049]HIK52992.1 hypothetical protein [Oscillatoriales cyanobacterium M59_W2019_021]
MENLTSGTQVTFYYLNGEVETFQILMDSADFYQQLQNAGAVNWLGLHLPDQTVAVSLDKVVKIEIEPPCPELEADGTFPNAMRITALQRAARR